MNKFRDPVGVAPIDTSLKASWFVTYSHVSHASLTPVLNSPTSLTISSVEIALIFSSCCFTTFPTNNPPNVYLHLIISFNFSVALIKFHLYTNPIFPLRELRLVTGFLTSRMTITFLKELQKERLVREDDDVSFFRATCFCFRHCYLSVFPNRLGVARE